MVCRALTPLVVSGGRYDGYLCSKTPYVRMILIGLAARMRLEICTCAVNSYHHRSISSFFFNVSDQIGHEMTTNETKLNGEYDYECIRNTLSTYPSLSR